ncbi:MAG: hypothetical protein KDJ65_23890 [Anaerolineae bacterium]|nr:hypothetical protein [Anaerolineae bacterium]
MNTKDYFVLLVIASPLLCAAIGYGLEGSWQGILLGAGSGMLLGGVLRRIIAKLTENPDNEETTPASDLSSSPPPESRPNN